MSQKCDKCGKEGTIFSIKPGSVYLCPTCELATRKDKKRKEE